MNSLLPPDGGGIDYLPFILTLYSARLRQVFVSRGVGAKNTLLEHVPLPETLTGLSLCRASAPASLGLLSCVKFYLLMNERMGQIQVYGLSFLSVPNSIP